MINREHYSERRNKVTDDNACLNLLVGMNQSGSSLAERTSRTSIGSHQVYNARGPSDVITATSDST